MKSILGFGKPKRRASGRACREKLSRRRGGRREQLGKAALLEDDVCGRCAMRNLREILSIVGRWRPRTLLDPVIDAYQASRQRKDHVPDDCQAGARTGPPPRAARPRPKKTKSMPGPYPDAPSCFAFILETTPCSFCARASSSASPQPAPSKTRAVAFARIWIAGPAGLPGASLWR